MPKKTPKLRMVSSKTDPAGPESDVSSRRRSTDTFLTLFLIAIILAVFILLLMLYKNNRVRPNPVLKDNLKSPQPDARPDVQAELIDVDHIIPQDSISLLIDKTIVTIDRGSNNHIVIPEKVVSSLHATISYENGQYYLEDNQSTNGTRLNNKLLEQNTRVKLKSGDIIHFARCEFRFLVHDQAPYGETMLIDADEISR